MEIGRSHGRSLLGNLAAWLLPGAAEGLAAGEAGPSVAFDGRRQRMNDAKRGLLSSHHCLIAYVYQLQSSPGSNSTGAPQEVA